MRDLNDAIAEVAADIRQVQASLAERGDACRKLIKEQEALHGQVREDFNALARLHAQAAIDSSCGDGQGPAAAVQRRPAAP